MSEPSWVYGLTTVPQRSGELLPRTLKSLALAGFERPRLFVDGGGLSIQKEPPLSELAARYERDFPGLPLTVRSPNLRCHGNWWLALQELFLRDTGADFYAVFQDDFVAYRNLRAYLSRNPCPANGYMNLYTAFASNEPVVRGQPLGTWHEAGLNNPLSKNPNRWQNGRGAVALAFSRKAAYTLLTSPKMIEHATDSQRGWRKVDGAVVNALNQAGFREYVHMPSLVQHTGQFSTTKSLPMLLAQTFLAEETDALSFLVAGADDGSGGMG